MNNDLVEKVARALLDSARSMKQTIPSWEDAAEWVHPECGLTMQEAARVEARAALRVVREELAQVTPAMCAAYEQHGGDYANAEGDWRAMLTTSPLWRIE